MMTRTTNPTEMEELLAEGKATAMRNGRPITVDFDSETADTSLVNDLCDEEITLVSIWIKQNIRAADSNQSGYSSYGLKHELEHDTKVYMTNNQFKHAMLLSGYKPNDYDELNWDFNIKLTRDIIENPNPLFNWLKQYEKEDSMVGDFARDTLADREFPSMADYQVIRRYLERCAAPEDYMRCFEEAWKRWTDYNGNA